MDGKKQRHIRVILQKSDEYMHELFLDDDVEDEVVLFCVNKHEECSYWAATGECDQNPMYMHKYCGPACQTCETLVGQPKGLTEGPPKGPNPSNAMERTKYSPKDDFFRPHKLEDITDDMFQTFTDPNNDKILLYRTPFGLDQEVETTKRRVHFDAKRSLKTMRSYMMEKVLADSSFEPVRDTCRMLHKMCIWWAVAGKFSSYAS